MKYVGRLFSSLSISGWTGQEVGGFYDGGYGFFPLDGHDVHACHAFDFLQTLHRLHCHADALVAAFFLVQS